MLSHFMVMVMLMAATNNTQLYVSNGVFTIAAGDGADLELVSGVGGTVVIDGHGIDRLIQRVSQLESAQNASLERIKHLEDAQLAPRRWVLAVNIEDDQDALFGVGHDLYTFKTNTTSWLDATSSNYGFGMNTLGLTETSMYRLECTDAADGIQRFFYLRGVSEPHNAWAGSKVMSDITSLECSYSEDFSSSVVKTGSACFNHLGAFDTTHTYYGFDSDPDTEGDQGISWALYAGDAYPYVLRHCRPYEGGSLGGNTGKIWVVV